MTLEATLNYKTLLCEMHKNALYLTIHRPEAKNSINAQLLTDINDALNHAEDNPDIRSIIIRGENNVFCTGMDFKAMVAGNTEDFVASPMESSDYMALLHRFASIPKVNIAEVDGTVMAGGDGFSGFQ